MELADWHTYQVLTKRSERLRDLLQTKLRHAAELPHIWWGVSVENRKHGLPRIDHLRDAPRRGSASSRSSRCWRTSARSTSTGIHWVIVGGESGPGARPMDKEWVLSIRDQCQRAGVPFFFKQWGGVRKSKAGRDLDGHTYDAFPHRAYVPVPDTARRLSIIRKVEAM